MWKKGGAIRRDQDPLEAEAIVVECEPGGQGDATVGRLEAVGEELGFVGVVGPKLSGGVGEVDSVVGGGKEAHAGAAAGRCVDKVAAVGGGHGMDDDEVSWTQGCVGREWDAKYCGEEDEMKHYGRLFAPSTSMWSLMILFSVG